MTMRVGNAILRLVAISLLIVIAEVLVLSIWHPLTSHPMPRRIAEILQS